MRRTTAQSKGVRNHASRAATAAFTTSGSVGQVVLTGAGSSAVSNHVPNSANTRPGSQTFVADPRVQSMSLSASRRCERRSKHQFVSASPAASPIRRPQAASGSAHVVATTPRRSGVRPSGKRARDCVSHLAFAANCSLSMASGVASAGSKRRGICASITTTRPALSAVSCVAGVTGPSGCSMTTRFSSRKQSATWRPTIRTRLGGCHEEIGETMNHKSAGRVV